MTPFEKAQIGLGSAGLLNEAFGNPLGSDSVNFRGKYYRKQMKNRTEYEPGLISANKAASITGAVKGAKEAGLHPLFALGASGGSSPSFQIPGQSPKGDFKADGLIAALGGMADRRNDLVMAQLTASALEVAKNATSNDAAQTFKVDMSPLNAPYQELDPGKVQPGRAGQPERNLSERRIWTDAWVYPGQKKPLKIPAEEVSEIFESAVLLDMTYNYPGNAEIINKYYGDRFKKAVAPAKANQAERRKRTRAFLKSLKPGKIRAKVPRSMRSRSYAGPQPYRSQGWRQ